MRLLVILLAALVLLFWQYQRGPEQIVEKIEPATSDSSSYVEGTDVSHQADRFIAVDISTSVPSLSTELDWLQAQLIDLFDYYLVEFEGDEAAMWQAFAKHCVSLASCSDITHLFERYVEYKKALADIDTPIEQIVAQISQRLDLINQTRLRFFSAREIDVLFAEQTQWQNDALERVAIRSNDKLTHEQKQAQLQAHFQHLDEKAQAAIAPSVSLEQVTAFAQRKQINHDDYNQLAAEYGAQAAERLIAVSEQRRAWRDKVNQYQEQLKQLKEQYQEQPVALEQAADRLRNEMFTGNEIKRLRVYLEK